MSAELVPINPRLPELARVAAGVDLYAAVLAGRNARTVRAYHADYQDFARFLGASTPEAALDALVALPSGSANAVALAYRASMTDRGLAAATISRRLAALRSAVRLAKTLGRVSWTLEVESPRSESFRDTSGPGDLGWRSVLERCKAAAAGGSPIAVRNLAIVRCLHDLGLRRGELAAVDLADVDLEAGTMSVTGKGRTEAVRLTLPEPVKKALSIWISIRSDEPGPLLYRLDRAARPGNRGRLTVNAIYNLVYALGLKSGLTRRLRPHGLRHQAITSVLDRSGGDIRAAARFSRHKDIRTLAIYDDNRKDLGGAMARLISDE